MIGTPGSPLGLCHLAFLAAGPPFSSSLIFVYVAGYNAKQAIAMSSSSLSDEFVGASGTGERALLMCGQR
jgi:hypothetical protein